LGIRLLDGRFFTEADLAAAPLVVIVNHKLAAHYWPGADPIGKRIRLASCLSSFQTNRYGILRGSLRLLCTNQAGMTGMFSQLSLAQKPRKC
jgi:hypothetical protein